MILFGYALIVCLFSHFVYKREYKKDVAEKKFEGSFFYWRSVHFVTTRGFFRPPPIKTIELVSLMIGAVLALYFQLVIWDV